MAANAYTAETVDFDLVPERYAKKVDFVTAEITLRLTKDWQHIVELWFKSDIGERYKDLMCDAQYTVLKFDHTEDLTGEEARKRTHTNSCSAAKANQIDKSIVRTLLYSIMSISGYFDGTGSGKLSSAASSTSMSKQFEDTLEAIIDNVTSSSSADTITVDSDKVTADLKTINVLGNRKTLSGTNMSIDTDSAGEDRFKYTTDNNSAAITAINGYWPDVMDRVGSENDGNAIDAASECAVDPTRLSTDDSLRTSTLGGLINAKAFLPVVNRLIRGGAFFVDTVQGEGHAYSADTLAQDSQPDGYGPIGMSYRDLVNTALVPAMRGERKFNPARQYRKADGTLGTRGGDGTDLHMIDYDSKLAFPVKVKVGGILSQDGTGGADGNTTAGGDTTVPTGSDGNHLNFQINIVVQADLTFA